VQAPAGHAREDRGRERAGHREEARGQGLTLAHFRAQLKGLRDTTLTLELNLSTFRTHPRVTSGYMGDTVSLSSAERGEVSSS